MPGRILGVIAALVAAAFIVSSPSAVQAQTPAPCPTGVTIDVAPPTPGAPTTITTTIDPAVVIKSPTEGDPASFHVHYFVDETPTAAGQAVPTGNPNIIHSISMAQDIGALEPGSHTVTVVLGQFNHAACEARGSVTFDAGETAVGAPSTGSGGFLDTDGESGVAAALAALGGGSLIASGIWFARRRQTSR